MKPLTTEEKAKLYEEAIEQAKKELATCGDMNCDAARQIFRLFPELKESEDERIRQRIIHALHGDVLEMSEIKEAIAWLERQGTPAKLSEEEQNRFAKGVLTSCAMSFIDYLDAHKYEGKMCVSNGECEDIENAFHNAMWDRLHRYYCKYIEKRGEQKSFDYENANIQQKDFAPKIEPKFHKGEWVVSKLDGKARQISEVHCDEYNDYYIVEGDEYQIEEYDRLHHLWNIADAKDGDVLFYDSTCGFTFIYNGINSEGALLYSYVESNDGSPLLKYNIGKPNVGIGYVTDKNIYPATKEQRDLLFQKMKEAGYEWDAEKKEPKRIEPQPSQWNISDFRTWQYIVCDVLTKYNGIGQYLDNGLCKQIAKYMQENWSKNLIQPQNTWKPSDKQMDVLLSEVTAWTKGCPKQIVLESLYNDLKKLREE